ncbi:MAG: hypothetical protein LCH88_18000 [Proteobacteria bacterium]|nr:hypothetical protein [Pseudomonadota bacterium]
MSDTSGYDEAPEEDIELGVAPEHAEIPSIKREFQRWHHPRKQWVRIQQWCSASRQLIKELNLPSGEPFRYLTLPGDELLDIRALSDVCVRENVKLRFLGFNSVGPQTPAQIELNISQNEVRSHAAVDNLSRVLEKRLETIANGQSQEFRAAQDLGPFHAINIDLCDSIAFRDVDDKKGSGLSVLAKLLELQLATNRPWLLFITTLAQPDLLSARNQAGFMEAIKANTAVSDEFKTELAGLISTSTDELDARLREAWKQQDPDFLRLFCTGLGKWLLRVLGPTQPSRSLTLLDSCYYRVGSQGPNMLSLVFRCDTQAQRLVDRDGILQAGADGTHEGNFSEVELAISLARKLSASSDLDGLIAQDAALAMKLIGQAGRLMAAARFDAAAYEAWATDELAKFKAPAAAPATVTA